MTRLNQNGMKKITQDDSVLLFFCVFLRLMLSTPWLVIFFSQHCPPGFFFFFRSPHSKSISELKKMFWKKKKKIFFSRRIWNTEKIQPIKEHRSQKKKKKKKRGDSAKSCDRFFQKGNWSRHSGTKIYSVFSSKNPGRLCLFWFLPLGFVWL